MFEKDFDSDGKIDAIYTYLPGQTIINADMDKDGKFEISITLFYESGKHVKTVEVSKGKYVETVYYYPDRQIIIQETLNVLGEVVKTTKFIQKYPLHKNSISNLDDITHTIGNPPKITCTSSGEEQKNPKSKFLIKSKGCDEDLLQAAFEKGQRLLLNSESPAMRLYGVELEAYRSGNYYIPIFCNDSEHTFVRFNEMHLGKKKILNTNDWYNSILHELLHLLSIPEAIEHTYSAGYYVCGCLSPPCDPPLSQKQRSLVHQYYADRGDPIYACVDYWIPVISKGNKEKCHAFTKPSQFQFALKVSHLRRNFDFGKYKCKSK